MEQLTTPQMKMGDQAFPGENWFFYWKSSSSLWESKLQNYSGPGPVFVPIYWGLHSEFTDQYDFGDSKPETDLKKLYDVSVRSNKEIVFILPLGPAPFLVNGGIPSYLARTTSKTQDKLTLACFDGSENLNRIYSFFDPNIYQSFRKFAKELSHYFSTKGIAAPIFGLNSFRFEQENLKSYFEDSSEVFDKGFNRYIKQLQDSEPAKVQRMIEYKSYELELKADYLEIVQNLYRDVATEFLKANFSGSIDMSFLGGDTQDLLSRSFPHWNKESLYFNPLFSALTRNILPSSTLLPLELKKGVLGNLLSDANGESFIRNQLGHDYYGDHGQGLSSLHYFEFIVINKNFERTRRGLEQAGLAFYIDRQYPWMYRLTGHENDIIEDMELSKIFFFFGEGMEIDNFNKMLKLFMSGARVFLDTSGLKDSFIKKIEIFFTENNLKVESLNYLSPIKRASLGEGSLVTYDSYMLSQSSLQKRSHFWESMISFLKLKHLNIQADDELYYFWKSRSSNTYELSYEEVRRVSFYNPTSYKKKTHIPVSQNFAYIKNVDLKNVEVKSTPMGINLFFMPGGSVSLDYGYYE